MKKVSWPYTGDPEKEMASLSPSGDSDRDIATEDGSSVGRDTSTPGYSALVAERHLSDELGVPISFQNGVLFPVSDEVDVNDLEDIGASFVSGLKKSSTVLFIESSDFNKMNCLKKDGHNIISLSKDSSEEVNLDDFHLISGDAMFFSMGKKIDAFCLEASASCNEDLRIALSNIYSQLRPIGAGLIAVNSNIDIKRAVRKTGFSIALSHPASGRYILAKNEMDKIATARYFGENSDLEISFECDVARTSQERTAGLQVYSDLKDRAGLLFPYKKPTDAIFHMGSVRFPIDIIFIDGEDRIKKIYKNIKPGSLEIFSCADVSSVLEISGGLSDSLGINPGGIIHIDYGELVGKKFRKESETLESLGVERRIFKTSSLLDTGLYGLSENNVYIINDKRGRSDTQGIIRDVLKLNSERAVTAFDIDSLYYNDKEITLYSNTTPGNEKRTALEVFGKGFSTDDRFIKIATKRLVEEGAYSKLESKYRLDLNSYLQNNILDSNERRTFIKAIAQAHKDGDIIVFASRRDMDKLLVSKLIEEEARVASGNYNLIINAEYIRVPERYGLEDIFNAVDEKYSAETVKACSSGDPSDIIKNAGIPVPDGTKGDAKKALRHFKRAYDISSDMIENLNKNLEEYEKVSGDKKMITGSKGEYKGSCKRNSRKVKRLLINIKDGIRILNSIKDVSTTSEVISSIAEASKIMSDSVKDVFDTISIIDTDGFTEELKVRTTKAETTLEDLMTTLGRGKDYITTNILGIVILVE